MFDSFIVVIKYLLKKNMRKRKKKILFFFSENVFSLFQPPILVPKVGLAAAQGREVASGKLSSCAGLMRSRVFPRSRLMVWL